MPIYYQKKARRVTATELHGDIALGNTTAHKGDYLVQTDDDAWFMTKKDFENTYEVDPASFAKVASQTLDDYVTGLFTTVPRWM